MRRVPPCVWVVNEHSEEIIVVISQYRPSRLWSGTDLNASASGAGLGFSTTVSGNSGGLQGMELTEQDVHLPSHSKDFVSCSRSWRPGSIDRSFPLVDSTGWVRCYHNIQGAWSGSFY